MKSKELGLLLKEKGFKEEKLDSGINYSKRVGHVELICYIEPNVEIEFISIYRWDNNDLKGSYNISLLELDSNRDSVVTFFKKTKRDMPQYIGLTVNVHSEIDTAIENTFDE